MSGTRKMSLSQRSETRNKSPIKRYLIALLVCVVLCLNQVDGQFFTRSSSKSIPRMGRRSDPEMAPSLPDVANLAAYRPRALFDALLDEFGQNLFRADFAVSSGCAVLARQK